MQKIRQIMARLKGKLSLIIIVEVVVFLVVALMNGMMLSSINTLLDKGPSADNMIGKLLIGISNFSAMAFVLFILINILLIMMFFKFSKNGSMQDNNFMLSEKGDYGTARWMNPKEEKEIFQIDTLKHITGNILGYKDNKELLYSYEPKDFRKKSNNHKVVIANSGVGKTFSVAIPDIYQAIRRGESVIATDPKGELYGETSELARKYGYNVKVINTIRPDASDCCDFLHIVNGQPLKAKLLMEVIMSALAAEPGFWNDTNKNLLETLILYVDSGYSSYPRTLESVYSLSAKSSQELSALFSSLPPEHPAKTPGMAYVEGDEKVKKSAQFGLFQKLGIFNDPDIRKVVSRNEIDLTAPGKEKCIYYVCISDQTSALDVIASMFFTCLFLHLVEYADFETDNRRLEVPVNMILDEFPNIAPIPDFAKKLNTVRSRGINITIIFQDITLLAERYPYTYSTLIANCDTWYFMAQKDMTTLKFIKDHLGDATIQVEQESSSKNIITGGLQPMSYQERIGTAKRPLMGIDEIRTLGKDKVLVFCGYERPIKLTLFGRTDHFLDKEVVPCNVHKHIPAWRQKEDDALNVSSASNMNHREIPGAPYFEPNVSDNDEPEYNFPESSTTSNEDISSSRGNGRVPPKKTSLNRNNATDETEYLFDKKKISGF